MKIQEMLYGWFSTALEEEMVQMRATLEAMIDAAGSRPKHDPLALLMDDLIDTLDSIDTNIEGLRREQKLAEQNAKYREDRPNA